MSRRREVWRPVGEEAGAGKGKPTMSMPYGVNSSQGSGSGGMGSQAYGARFASRGGLGGPGAGGSGSQGSQGRGGYQRRPQGYGRSAYGTSYTPSPSGYYGDGYGMERMQYGQQPYNSAYYQPRYSQDMRGLKTGYQGDRRDNRPQEAQGVGRNDSQSGILDQGPGSQNGINGHDQSSWNEAANGQQEQGPAGLHQQEQQQDNREEPMNGGSPAQMEAQSWETDHSSHASQSSTQVNSDAQPQAQSLQQLHLQMVQLAANSSPSHGKWGDIDSTPPSDGTGQLQQQQSAEASTTASAQEEANDSQTPTMKKVSSRAASPEVMSGDAGSSASHSGGGSPRRAGQAQGRLSSEGAEEHGPDSQWGQEHARSDVQYQLNEDTAEQEEDQHPGAGEDSANGVSPTAPGNVQTILDAVLQQESEQGGEQLQLIASYGDVSDEELMRLATTAASVRAQAQREEAERAAVYLARREIRRAQVALDETREEFLRREAELQARTEEAEQRMRDSEAEARRLKEKADELEKELHAHREEVEQTVWQKEGQLQEKASEAAALRKERDGALAESKAQASQREAERAELKAKIEELETQVTSKQQQLQDISEQLRSAQEELWRKEESSVQQAQSWAAHGQELEGHAAAMASMNQSLHAELRERTDQCNHLFLANQQLRQQLVESEQYHLQIIQQLQREVADLRGQPFKPQQPSGTPHMSKEQQDKGQQPDSQGNASALQGSAPPFVPGSQQQDGVGQPNVVRPIAPPFGVPGGPVPSAPMLASSGSGSTGNVNSAGSFMGFPPDPMNPAVRPGFLGGVQAFGIRPVGMPVMHPGAMGPRYANGMHGAPGDRPAGHGVTGPGEGIASTGGTPGKSSSAHSAVPGPPGFIGSAEVPAAGVVPGQPPFPMQQPGAPPFMGMGPGPPGLMPPGIGPMPVTPPALSPVPPTILPPPGLAAVPVVSPRPPEISPGMPTVPPGLPLPAPGTVPPGFGPSQNAAAGAQVGASLFQNGGQGQVAEKGSATSSLAVTASKGSKEEVVASSSNVMGAVPGGGRQEQEQQAAQKPDKSPQATVELQYTGSTGYTNANVVVTKSSSSAASDGGSESEKFSNVQASGIAQPQVGMASGSDLGAGLVKGISETPPSGASGTVGAPMTVPQHLMDERSLLTCLVRTLSPGQGGKLPISTTVASRLGRLLAPLSWEDYKPHLGDLAQFISSHPELFVMDGPDLVSLREGAHAIVASLPSPQASFNTSNPSTSMTAPATSRSKLPDVAIAVTPSAAAGNPAAPMAPPGLAGGAVVQNRAPAPHTYYNRQHGNTRGPIGQNYSKRPAQTQVYISQPDQRPGTSASGPEGQYSLYGNGHYAPSS